MIEIVFSDSACGSLKAAQHFGEGEYSGIGAGVCISITHADGHKPTQEEIDAARREFEEQERRAWEKATPLGGNPADIYGFSLALSVGDISEDIPGEKRRQVLEWLYGVYPDLEEGPAFTGEMMQRAADVLKEVTDRIQAGESARIWYSKNPEDMCGMHWFMAQLACTEKPCGPIYLVRLPEWETDDNGNIMQKSSWGEIAPGGVAPIF